MASQRAMGASNVHMMVSSKVALQFGISLPGHVIDFTPALIEL